MPNSKRSVFIRRKIDFVTDEIVDALADGQPIEFKPLFSKVLIGLKAKNATGGGEEMLRLRCYEKLLTLSKSGFIEKSAKTFRGLAGLDQATSVNQLARRNNAITKH